MDTVVSMPVKAGGDFTADAAAFTAYWRTEAERLAKLPAKDKRSGAEQTQAEKILTAAREARFAFLRVHARTLYDKLTDGRRKFVRLERLVYDAASIVP